MSKTSKSTRREWLKRASLISAVTATRPPLTEAANAFEKRFWDGKTLAAWHKPPAKIGHGTGGIWKLDPDTGILTGEQDPPGSGNGGLLLSDATFADFELTLDMRPDWGPCSGVFFRCNDLGHGFQMYVDYHDNGNVGHLRGEMPGAFALMPYKISLGPDGVDANGDPASLVTRPDPRTEAWPDGVYQRTCSAADWLDAWKLDDWNTATLRCVGKYPQVTVTINGLEVCHWDGATSTLPGYDKDKVFETLGPRGSIALQVHGGKNWPAGKKCRWRKLSIRDLS